MPRVFFIRPDTYRVFTQTTHKTDSTLYVNVTISDNATSSTWYQRVEQHSDVCTCLVSLLVLII
jgi:hypothetical protein